MITCTCCGDTKPTSKFTHSKKFGYAKHCRECGIWLRLLRQVFGPTRDWEKNRENMRTRLKTKHNKPILNLYEAWGIRKAA